ncbi:MAG: ABC transporter ATP-binding protein, partial [bacterium]
MANIILKNASKHFESVKAIDQVNFEVRDGEFMVLVGPSGCGKSTLLRSIAGLEEITSGQILIDDRDVTALHSSKRDLAMVFQSYALYPHMNVYKNLSFGLETMRIPQNVIEERVNRAAKILQIDQLLKRKPKQLSGGQKQRVAIGRAIVREPKAFLFDEPLSNLDADLRVQMRVEIARLQKRLGVTTIYVTHDQVEAMTMADRIVVLNGGRVEQIGKPLELYNTPNNVFVAGFIGSPRINLLQLDDLVQLRKSQQATISDSLMDLFNQQKVHQLGFRPEMIKFTSDGIANSLVLNTEVSYMEQLGSESYIYLEIENQLNLVMHNQGQQH